VLLSHSKLLGGVDMLQRQMGMGRIYILFRSPVLFTSALLLLLKEEPLPLFY